MSKLAVPSIPPLSSVSDPNVRAVLQAIVDGQRIRNGDVGDGDEKFLTVADLNGGASQLTATGGGASTAQSSKITQSVATALRKISDKVMQSRAWKLLDEGITRIASDVAVVKQTVSVVSDQSGDAIAAVTTMQSQIGDINAAAQEALTLSTSVDETVKGAWTVKFDVNGYIAGVALGVEKQTGGPPKSTFVVRADTFAVGSPGAQDVVPFVVDGGVTYIAKAVIPLITADMIDSRGLAIRDESGNIILGSGTALRWDNIASVGQNLVRSLAVWSFFGSPGFWLYTSGSSAEDGLWLVLEDTAATVTADSPQMTVPPGEFTVSFDACVISGGNRDLYVDLFPDDLPQSLFTISGSAWKAYQATWSSSSANLANCRLRFFSVAAGGGRLYVRNIKLEVGPAKTAWSAHPLDSVNVRNPITSANASTYIANAAIDTLTLAGSAVTVPVVAKLARTIEGAHDDPYSFPAIFWSLTPINRARIYLNQAGIVYAHTIASQWYGQGERYSNLGLEITDSRGLSERVSEGGGAVVPSPVVATSMLCAAGWVDIKVYWIGQPGCRITDCIIFATGAKR